MKDDLQMLADEIGALVEQEDDVGFRTLARWHSRLAALLAQPDQSEPVAWTNDSALRLAKNGGTLLTWNDPKPHDTPLYTHPDRTQAPGEWVLVPREATDEMIEAAWDSDAADYVGEHKRIHCLHLAWTEMLAAAPTPPSVPGKGGAK